MKKQLTVLQVLPALEQGGVERGTVQIDNALVAAGYESLVVSNGGKLVAELKGEHFQIPANTKNPLKILFNAHVMSTIIKMNDVDIVHARSRAPAWSAFLATRFKKNVKYMNTFHGTYGTKGAIKRWYNAVMLRGEKVIAVSNFIKEHIEKNYNVSRETITVIHRGFDVDKFDPETKPVKFGIPEGKKIVLLPGRITRWKGQKEFAQAMVGVDAIGVIVGDSESPNYMRELEEVLPDNVVIMPGSNNMPEVYAAADIVVSNSLNPEAFGRVAIEAQAMGKPIIATAHGGSMETVVEGKTGYLVEPGNVKSLSAAIRMALSSEIDPQDCVENSKNFTVGKMAEKTLAIYNELAK